MHPKITIHDLRQKFGRVAKVLRSLGKQYKKILAKFPFSRSVSRSVENLIYPDFRGILTSLTEAIRAQDLEQAKFALNRFFESVSDETLLSWLGESQNPVFINSARYLINLIFENQLNIESILVKPGSQPLVSPGVEILATLCCLSNHKDGLKRLVTFARKKAEEGKSKILRTCFSTAAQYPRVFENLFFELAADFFKLPLSAWKNLKTATLLYLYIYSSPTIERVNFLQNLSRWLAGQLMLLRVHQEDPTQAFGISILIEEIHQQIVSHLPENLRNAEINFFEKVRSLGE